MRYSQNGELHKVNDNWIECEMVNIQEYAECV